MSLEAKIETLTAAVMALTAALQAAPVAAAPSYPAQAPAAPAQPVYQAPVAAATIAPTPPMPAQPFPPAAQAPAPAGLPFTDNVSAAAWATDAWQKAAAVNQDVAMAKFGAMMQALGAADFNHLTPDKFPLLFQSIQAIKAELGIPG